MSQQPSRIPIQRYCWACDAAFETTSPRQQNCDRCIEHYNPRLSLIARPHVVEACLRERRRRRATAAGGQR